MVSISAFFCGFAFSTEVGEYRDFVSNFSIELSTGLDTAYRNTERKNNFLGLYGLNRSFNNSSINNLSYSAANNSVLKTTLSFDNNVVFKTTLSLQKSSGEVRNFFNHATGLYERIDYNNYFDFVPRTLELGSDNLTGTAQFSLQNLKIVDEVLFGEQIPMYLSKYSLHTKGSGLFVKKQIDFLGLELYGSRIKSQEDSYRTYAQGLDDFSLGRTEYWNAYVGAARMFFDASELGIGKMGFHLVGSFRDFGVNESAAGLILFIRVKSKASNLEDIATLIDGEMALDIDGTLIPFSAFTLTDASDQIDTGAGLVPNDTSPGAGDAFNKGSYVYRVNVSEFISSDQIENADFVTLRFNMRGRYIIQISSDQVSWSTVFDRAASFGAVRSEDSDNPRFVRINKKDFATETGFFSAGLFADMNFPLTKDDYLYLNVDAGMNREIIENLAFEDEINDGLGILYPFVDLDIGLKAFIFDLKFSYFDVPSDLATEIKERKNKESLSSRSVASVSANFVSDSDSGYGNWKNGKSGIKIERGKLNIDQEIDLPNSPYYRSEFYKDDDKNNNGTVDKYEYDDEKDYPHRPGEKGFSLNFDAFYETSFGLYFGVDGFFENQQYFERQYILSAQYETIESNIYSSVFEDFIERNYYQSQYGGNFNIGIKLFNKILSVDSFTKVKRTQDQIPDHHKRVSESYYNTSDLHQYDYLSGFDNLIFSTAFSIDFEKTFNIKTSFVSSLEIKAKIFGEFKNDQHFQNLNYLSTMNTFLNTININQGYLTLTYFNQETYSQNYNASTENFKLKAFSSLGFFKDALFLSVEGELWKYRHTGDLDIRLNQNIDLYIGQLNINWNHKYLKGASYLNMMSAQFPDETYYNQSIFKAGVFVSYEISKNVSGRLSYEHRYNNFVNKDFALRNLHYIPVRENYLEFKVNAHINFDSSKSVETVGEAK